MDLVKLDFRANSSYTTILNEYEPLNIQCSVNINELYSLEIYFDKSLLAFSVGNKLNLRFEKTLRSNQGTYTCYVLLDGKVKDKSIVEVEVKCMYFKRRIHISICWLI